MATVRKREWTTAKGVEKAAYFVDFYDNNGDRQRKQFNRFKAADKFRVKMEGQLSDGTHRPDADRVTVSEVCKSFLAHCQDRMERNERMTRKMFVVYQGHVNNHILHPDHGVGRTTLAQFTKKSVIEFRDMIRSSGVTVPTTRKVLSTLHGAIEYAVSQELVAVNAAHRVKVIAPRGEGSKKIKPPSKSDMKAILNAAGDDFRFIVLFAASTGLRAGEQWALRWGGVDAAEGMLVVERRVDAYGEEGPPKSDAGMREVPLSSMLLTSLKERRIQSKFSGEVDLIFPNKKGNYTCHDNLIKRLYRPTLEGAGVSGINWHSLRHYAISTWIEAGLAPKTIQTFAGHSSLSVTMDRYGHLFPSDDHKAAMDAIAGELMG
jgi:integrase